MANVLDVANYFIVKSHNEQGDDADITILKLQKLCYYAQGLHLATKNQPLFNNDLLAWTHGPVVKELHDAFGGRGAVVIDKPNLELAQMSITPEELETINDVYSYFGQFSAWKLRNMTHQEAPWLNTARNDIISRELIKAYFEENIVA